MKQTIIVPMFMFMFMLVLLLMLVFDSLFNVVTLLTFLTFIVRR